MNSFKIPSWYRWIQIALFISVVGGILFSMQYIYYPDEAFYGHLYLSNQDSDSSWASYIRFLCPNGDIFDYRVIKFVVYMFLFFTLSLAGKIIIAHVFSCRIGLFDLFLYIFLTGSILFTGSGNTSGPIALSYNDILAFFIGIYGISTIINSVYMGNKSILSGVFQIIAGTFLFLSFPVKPHGCAAALFLHFGYLVVLNKSSTRILLRECLLFFSGILIGMVFYFSFVQPLPQFLGLVYSESSRILSFTNKSFSLYRVGVLLYHYLIFVIYVLASIGVFWFMYSHKLIKRLSRVYKILLLAIGLAIWNIGIQKIAGMGKHVLFSPTGSYHFTIVLLLLSILAFQLNRVWSSFPYWKLLFTGLFVFIIIQLCVIPTANPIIHVVLFHSGFSSLLILIFALMINGEQVKRIVFLHFPVVSGVIILFSLFYSLHCCGIANEPFIKSVKADKLPRGSSIRLDPEYHDSILDLYQQIQEYGYCPGDTMLALGGTQPLAYFLGGYEPGLPLLALYYEHSVKKQLASIPAGCPPKWIFSDVNIPECYISKLYEVHMEGIVGTEFEDDFQQDVLNSIYKELPIKSVSAENYREFTNLKIYMYAY